MSTRKKSKWNCLYCNQNTQYEHFFLKDKIWKKIHPSKFGMICIGCCEKRLKRKFNKADFTNAYINNPKFGKKSLVLLERLGAKK